MTTNAPRAPGDIPGTSPADPLTISLSRGETTYFGSMCYLEHSSMI